MRTLFVLPVILGLAGAAPASAASNEIASKAPVEPSARHSEHDPLLDAIAAEFFENRLRLSQSRRIEAETARHYLSLPVAAKARFREQRREAWRRMTNEEKALLRGVKLPRYANLTEDQKQAFRRIAAQELGMMSVPTLSVSLRDEI